MSGHIWFQDDVVRCVDCCWRGNIGDLISKITDGEYDYDGDKVACPKCGGENIKEDIPKEVAT